MSNYVEILCLKNLEHKFNIKTEVQKSTFGLSKVRLSIQHKSHTILIHDEYNDLKLKNPLLNLCLVLRDLEIYKESSDFLDWCKTQCVNPDSNELRTYYKGLEVIYNEVESKLGKIDSQISDLDFQLNSGAAWELRNSTPLSN
jgi:hypothetical protein